METGHTRATRVQAWINKDYRNLKAVKQRSTFSGGGEFQGYFKLANRAAGEAGKRGEAMEMQTPSAFHFAECTQQVREPSFRKIHWLLTRGLFSAVFKYKFSVYSIY